MAQHSKICEEPIQLEHIGFSEADRMIHWLRKHIGQCNVDWRTGASSVPGTSEMYIYKENHRLLFLIEWSHVVVTDKH